MAKRRVDRRDDRMLHVRFEGRSRDIPCRDLDLGALSSDNDVREALADYLDVPVRKFRAYVIERHDNGNITVRPEATFG
jgi:hypothetical protein